MVIFNVWTDRNSRAPETDRGSVAELVATITFWAWFTNRESGIASIGIFPTLSSKYVASRTIRSVEPFRLICTITQGASGPPLDSATGWRCGRSALFLLLGNIR